MFRNLIGNQTIKDAIRRYLSNQRVPNSLLFAGPEGVGKKLFALELAKAIVCRQPVGHEACGSCAACTRVNNFEFPGADAKGEDYDRVFFSDHADVGMVVPFNQNVRVGSIRALEAEANFRPYEAPSRVFIINESHKMNAASSNALLKTLEEPPATSHIFLITSKPNALLPTIRSRVQTLRFGPVAANEIEHLLLTTHEYSQSDARLIASSTNGSVSAALSVDAEEFRSRRDQAIEILRTAIVSHDVAEVLRQSEKVGAIKSTSEFEGVLDMLLTIIHRIWAAKMATDRTEEDKDIVVLVERADTKALSEWLLRIEEIRGELAVNINKKIASDSLFVKMAAR